jgi:hypothetical protein
MDLIPRLCAAETAIRKMAVALATRQELLNCSPDKLYELSLVRTGAMSATVHELTQPGCSVLAILQCGLLFIGYECLQDPMLINVETSVRHLAAGLRILEEYRAERLLGIQPTTSASDVIENYIEPMYLQMEMMLSMFNNPIHTIRDLASSHTETQQPKLPPRFTDLAHARDVFFKIYRWHYVYRAEGHKLWTHTSPAFLTVRQVFVDWHTLIMAYNDTLSASGRDELERQKLMTMVSRWSLLMVSMVHSTTVSRGPNGSPLLPRGGRMRTSVVDLLDQSSVTITFIVDAHSLAMLEICDWTDSGLGEDPKLRMWPLVEVRRLEDGSGRGLVKWKMG